MKDKWTKVKRDDYAGAWVLQRGDNPKDLYREANMGNRVWYSGSEAEADALLVELNPPEPEGKGK